MNEEAPPPLRPAPRRPWRKVAIAVAALVSLSMVALVVLRLTGLIAVYHLPTGSMAPAIKPGDDIFVEGVTYLFRKPARGEIVAFHTNKSSATHEDEKYVKRLVGLPGEQLQITGGLLYVDGQPVSFHNKEGEVHYTNNAGLNLRRDSDTFVVPADSYFVLGDNSPNSADSRMWGAVPASAVFGRAVFCYEPAADAGWLR